MNTPKTPKRGMRTKALVANATSGKFKWSHIVLGIQNDSIAIALADAIAQWTYSEDTFVEVLAKLLGTETEIATEVFHALATQNTRLPIYRALLENPNANKDKPQEYDDLITEFDRLNGERNKLVHWYWITDCENGKIYRSKARRNTREAIFDGEEVTKEQIEQFTQDCRGLDNRVWKLIGRVKAEHLPSRGK